MPSPFYTTTPRYALRSLLGTSNGSDIDAGFLAALDDVENAFAGYKSGTHAARLAATALDGLLWRETDAPFLLYLGNGSTWLPVMVPGVWQALTLATNIGAAAGGYAPSARLEGDVVRLRGTMQNNTGGTLTNQVWMTLPVGLRPTVTVLTVPVAYQIATPQPPTNMTISGSNGQAAVVAAITGGNFVYLDDVTFTT